MSQEPISALNSGTPKGTDIIPGVDTTDTTQSSSGSTKKYTRASEFNFYMTAQGIRTLTACVVGTTSNLTATYSNGTLGVGATLTNSGTQDVFTVDGIIPVVNSRVLVKNQATLANNGIYTLTNVGSVTTDWVLTRARDYDQASEIMQYDVLMVTEGTVNAGIAFQQTNPNPFIVGSTDIVFSAYTTNAITIPLPLNEGGTNADITANNGAIMYSTATEMALLANPLASGKILQSGNSSAPIWSTPTYPSASGTSGKVLSSDGTNIVYSTATFPVVSGTLGNIIISDGSNYISSTSLWPNTVGTSGLFLISNGTSNVYSTSTIPASSGATANKVLLSDGTNYVLSIPTFPNASATAGKFIRSDGTNWIASTPTLPTTAGTSGKVLQSDGTNYIESTPTYPSASGSAGKILRSDGTNNTYSSSTFADTYSASSILYSNGANTVAGLATANSGVLTTDSGGVPSITLLSNLGINASLFKTTKSQTFTSNGTYTPSTGMLYCIIQAVGAGGGGGGATSGAAQSGCGGGGGSGAFCQRVLSASQIVSTASITIGTAGTSGTAGNTGGTGGTSTVIANGGAGATLLSATGGTGGSATNSVASFTFASGGNGGTATNGDINITGGYGMDGIAFSTNASGLGGMGGASYFGGGGQGGAVGGGSTGMPYGSGGGGGGIGGAAGSVTGGAGAGGAVVVIEFCNQ